MRAVSVFFGFGECELLDGRYNWPTVDLLQEGGEDGTKENGRRSLEYGNKHEPWMKRNILMMIEFVQCIDIQRLLKVTFRAR